MKRRVFFVMAVGSAVVLAASFILFVYSWPYYDVANVNPGSYEFRVLMVRGRFIVGIYRYSPQVSRPNEPLIHVVAHEWIPSLSAAMLPGGLDHRFLGFGYGSRSSRQQDTANLARIRLLDKQYRSQAENVRASGNRASADAMVSMAARELGIAMRRPSFIEMIEIPLWAVVLLAAVLPIRWLRMFLRERKIRLLGLCQICGYDLRATPDPCPECGIAPSKLGRGGRDVTETL